MKHPEPEILAAFAEGRLDGTELAAVAEHLRDCAECRRIVGETARFLRETPATRSRRRPVWLAVAAAAIVAIAAGMLWVMHHRPPIEELIAAAPRDVRFVEPRLTGFPAAPLAAVVRGPQEVDPRQMRLTGAAGDVLQKTSGDPAPDSVHANVVAQIGSAQKSVSIRALRQAAQQSGDAAMWNDLSAACYVASAEDAEQLKYALAAADQALRIAPAMPEALFNRALILTQLQMKDAAVAAWNRYLSLEASGPFADEARRHLRDLQRVGLEFPQAVEQKLAQLQRGDRAAAVALLEADAGEVRSFVETEVLASWGQSMLRGDTEAAARHLNGARTVSSAMLAFNGEPMLAEAVAAIDRADDATRKHLALAHVAYSDGRRAYRPLRRPQESERLLTQAANEFRGRSPMELVARTYRGVAIFGQNRIDEAQQSFGELSRTVPPKYVALSAYLRWQRASCVMARAAWSESIDDLTTSLAAFDGLGEHSNAAYLHDILSQVYGLIGDGRSSWEHRVIALRSLGPRSNHRLEHLIGGVVYDALKRKEWHEALSFLDLEIDLARRVQDKELESNLFLRRALVASRLGNEPAAGSDLRSARAVIASIDDSALRRRLEAESDAATAMISSRPQTAIHLLSDALQFHQQNGWRALMPDLYLRRGQMYRRLGDETQAASDFEAGIVELERERASVHAGEQRWGVFDTSEELFDEAMALAVGSQPAVAFAYAERKGEAAGRFEPASIGPDTAIIRYASLPGTLLVLTARRGGVTAKQIAIGRDELGSRIARFCESLRNGSASDEALGDLLVPDASAREMAFITDEVTAAVPFAALRVAGEPLVETHTISVAPSARLYLAARAHQAAQTGPPATALVVDSPATDGLAPLGYARAEAEAILTVYPRVERLSGAAATPEAFLRQAPNAQVIHFAGHGVAGGPSAALVLARAGNRAGVIDTATIALLPLSHTGVVVLAACESGRGPARSAGVLSVANAFLQAGAPAVIATLWPIADRDAADFFPRLHRHLARGERPSEALRETQLECMRDPQCNHTNLWAAVEAMGS